MSDVEEHRTPVSLQGLPQDDPHLQPAAKDPEGLDYSGVVAFSFVLGMLGVAGFSLQLMRSPGIVAATMGVGPLLRSATVLSLGKYLMPRGPFVEERHTLANDEAEREAFAAAIVERGGGIVKRRKVLAGHRPAA